MIRCYALSDLSMKFQRGLTCDVVAMECLSDDFAKMVLLQGDRTLAFHAPYGAHYTCVYLSSVGISPMVLRIATSILLHLGMRSIG